MASNQGKKKVAGTRNGDRRNGKAWKKPKKARVRTPERLAKDQAIRAHRDYRREENMAKHRARLAAEEEARLAREAEKALLKEQEEAARQEVINAKKKPHVPAQKLEFVAA